MSEQNKNNINDHLPLFDLNKANAEMFNSINIIESSTSATDNEQKSLFNKKIILNPGITKINYICSLLHFITMVFIFISVDTLQLMILLHPKYFNVKKEDSGEMMAKILLILLVYKILVSPLYGYFIDRFGRVIMVRIGASFILIACLSVPLQRNVFPGFIISKILFANGGSIFSLLPFNGDYVHDSTKGKAAGLQLTLGTIGGLFGALFVKTLLWLDLTIGQCYVVSGILVFSISITYSFGLESGNEYYKKARTLDKYVNESTFKTKFLRGWHEINQSPWLLISLLLTIVGNADFYILTILFALFVKSFFGNNNLDTDTSNHLISSWQLISFSFAAVFNIIAGYYIDKVNIIKIIIPTLVTTIISFLFSICVSSPYDIYFKIMVIFPSICLPVIYTSSNYLTNKHTPSDIRGTINSFLGIIGYMGYVFIALFGGILFDEVHRSGPYLLYSLLLTISTVLILKIYLNRIVRKDAESVPCVRT